MKYRTIVYLLFFIFQLHLATAHAFNTSVVVDGLDHPWGMAFLPGGDILITERTGKLRFVKSGKLLDSPVKGLPVIREVGQGGLLGITIHPRFSDNQLVYLSYAGKEGRNYGTEVLRGRLDGMALKNVEVIFRAEPKTRGGRHFGSRLLFAPDGTLYISLGDRGGSTSAGRDQNAQRLDNHIGALIRVNDDGSVPGDNPFVGKPDVRPEIYTYGNRNMQGMALHPVTKQVWTHEHGPQGGDEVNIMEAGVNYGWPVITYGENYGLGTKIGEGTHMQGMRQPVYKWIPSIAPSGMMFYSADKFPEWHGDLFVGSLRFNLLVRLEVQDNKIINEERLFKDQFGRIRDVVQGPDGHIYLLTDDNDGKLVKITP